MNCRWEDAEPRDQRGWRRVRCVRPGCNRVSKSKTPHANPKFPCRAWPQWWEWGEWAAILLAAFFVTPRSVGWLVHQLGLIEVPEGCGLNCDARKEWLNSFGGRLSQSTTAVGRWLCRHLVRRHAPNR